MDMAEDSVLNNYRNMRIEVKCNSRSTLDRVDTMKAILINIFLYGRSQKLDTGWNADKNVLYDMDVCNVMRSTNSFVFGDCWKHKLQFKKHSSFPELIEQLEIYSGTFYLDHSEKIYFAYYDEKRVALVRSRLRHTGAVQPTSCFRYWFNSIIFGHPFSTCHDYHSMRKIALPYLAWKTGVVK